LHYNWNAQSEKRANKSFTVANGLIGVERV